MVKTIQNPQHDSFGAKSNNILIDGISFIEKLSFNAFNEGTRLRHCISLAQKLPLFSEEVEGKDEIPPSKNQL